jgi:ABC-type Mn2+/Zn2+ transport system ATPase subunit
MPAKASDTKHDFFISRVYVERLFGQYTYDLELTGGNNTLFIVYGDNGSGKTTLLKLIFHLLSPEGAKGHRTYLAQTLFSHFEVMLADGTRIIARRKDDRLEGTYTISISRSDESHFEIELPTNDDNTIGELPPESEQKYREFLKQLAGLNIVVHFLSDDRKVWSDIYTEDEEESFAIQVEKYGREIALTRDELFHRALATTRRDRPNELILRRAIDRMVQRIRQQVLRGSDVGTANTNNIYTEIIRRIASSSAELNSVPTAEADALISTLEKQEKRSEDFSRFGLATKVTAKELIATLRSARPDTLPIIHSVLRPYVHGIEARLDALQSIRDSVATFVDNLNSFYTNKQVRFHLQRGLTIRTPTNEQLSTSMLSSGEKQLLLLFCNTLSAQDRASIFIVDEPEISLNVKWQRNLVQALLDCVKGSGVQFVMATHSLELIARHRDNVVKLTTK